MCVVYWPTFIWLKNRFLGVESYYTHGFLVPFVVAFLVWQKRDDLAKTPIVPLNIGLVILILSLLAHFTAFSFKVNFISGFSIISTLIGLILYLFGKEFLFKLTFPIFFLVFMIPLPRPLIIHISFKMKMLVAQIAAYIVNAMGISALRAGSVIHLPNTSLTVGSPCSGLRSLISLTALGSIYAYLVNISLPRKFILFLTSIPLALISNVIRVILLLLVAYVYGSEVATGKFHDYSGFLVFIIAFLGLKIMGNILSVDKGVEKEEEKKTEDKEEESNL
ncbi:MAG: exosortase/archaeosortase family protein [Candidatus Auribacterota bacterium]|nr:exosortase/archaeosortase family protein [Candidatus Auribacterota bacterium]